MDNQTSITTLTTLYQQLGTTIAEILGHEDCPVLIYDQLSNLMVNIENRTPSVDRQILFARKTFPECLSVLGDLTAVPERRQRATARS